MFFIQSFAPKKCAPASSPGLPENSDFKWDQFKNDASPVPTSPMTAGSPCPGDVGAETRGVESATGDTGGMTRGARGAGNPLLAFVKHL